MDVEEEEVTLYTSIYMYLIYTSRERYLCIIPYKYTCRWKKNKIQEAIRHKLLLLVWCALVKSKKGLDPELFFTFFMTELHH